MLEDSFLAEIIRPLQKMIKKNAIFNWGQTEKESFQKILEAISEAPSFLSPDFNKDLILYTFASKISYAVVLTQINQQNNEVPISFMSSNFKGVELHYHEVDKQAFAIFKAVKHFCPYLLKSKTKVIVPYSSVRNLLVQKDLGEKKAPWMTALQEYDLEIKPSTIVKGKGLCKLAAEAAHLPNDKAETAIDEVLLNREIYFYPPPQDS